jgi:hypothetical protein
VGAVVLEVAPLPVAARENDALEVAHVARAGDVRRVLVCRRRVLSGQAYVVPLWNVSWALG